MDRNRNQYLLQKCQKSAEWNEIYIEKNQIKTSTNTQTEENQVKLG